MTSPCCENEDARLAALHSLNVLDTAHEDIYDDIVLLAASICGVPIAAVSLIDTERQWFKSILGLDISETPRAMAFCTHTILQPDVLVVEDAQTDARFASNPLVTGAPNIRFYAGAPLIMSDGHALGSLCVIDQVPRQLSKQQEAALRVLARQVTSQLEAAHRTELQERLSIERRQAEEAVRRSEARLAEAQAVAHIGSWEFDIPTRRITWSQEMFRLFGLDPAGNEPSLEGLMSYFHPADLPMLSALIEKAMQDGQSYEVDIRVRSDDGFRRWSHAMGQGERDENGQVVRLFGTMTDITERKQAEEHIRDYSVVLEYKMAELEQANNQLAALATTDGLTGLKNHRAFQEQLADEYQRAIRFRMPLSLILLDVDFFKRFNDTFGHPAGDAVLKEVGCLLMENVREVDTAARHGGEEFAVILPSTDSARACVIAERLRRAIEQAAWLQRRITVSIGVSSLQPGMNDHSILIDRADKALYQSKRAGRNRVTSSENTFPENILLIPAASLVG